MSGLTPKAYLRHAFVHKCDCIRLGRAVRWWHLNVRNRPIAKRTWTRFTGGR